MVAYSFKARFGPLIRTGAKTQTVRADRKRHARPGETLQLYTGMRTRSCTLLATATCVAVQPVRFDFAAGVNGTLEIAGDLTAMPDRMYLFAVRDGFKSWGDLRAFWAQEHPGLDQFEGVLIQWRDLVLPE